MPYIIAEIILVFLLLMSVSLNAKDSHPDLTSSFWTKFKKNLQDTWTLSTDADLYVPLTTRHLRFAYNEENLKRYNENPWGLGTGVSRYDVKGDWHSFYTMIFKDSFNKWEPIVGYAWERTWQPLNTKNIRVGTGFTAGITVRENWNYIPIPVPLPLFSVGFKRTNIQMTYIPGTRNNGNVYFAWLRFKI